MRTRQCRPFEVTWVDFTGALHIKTPDGSEIVSDLSVETFLQTLRRFAAHRSLPRIMLSDNASTYEAATAELARLINSDRMGESLCTLGIQWRFIPKKSPLVRGVLGTPHWPYKDNSSPLVRGVLGTPHWPYKDNSAKGIRDGACRSACVANCYRGDRSRS